MSDNVDIAVLTKLNDLADRYGLKPYDFVAIVKDLDPGSASYALTFEIPAQGNALREKRFDQMLVAIGILPDAESAQLIGTPATIVDALDQALQHAPRPPGRF